MATTFRRPVRVNALASGLITLICAAILLALAVGDLFVFDRLAVGEPLKLSVRVPAIGQFKDTLTVGASYRVERVLVGRGEQLSAHTLKLLQAYEAQRRPPTVRYLTGLGVCFLLSVLLYVGYLRRQSGEISHARTQIVLLSTLVVYAILARSLLLLTSWSAIWIPLPLLASALALSLGPRVAAVSAALGALIATLFVPVDVSLLAVLLAQGLSLAAIVRPHQKRSLLGATLASGLCGLAAYTAIQLVLAQYLEFGISAETFDLGLWLRSDLVAAVVGPLILAPAGLLAVPLIERALGHPTKSQLIALADYDNPLLKRLAQEAPGTWAHSLNMANLAEMAANAIGANALLARVGAYYHDVGKARYPDYFIENQQGQQNPHDHIAPEASADAIFGHVTDGVKLARRKGVPERIVQFIYTHHGDGVLEYFWQKVQDAGNPTGNLERDFRYPGIRPQTRETGILAIVDAIEAASKSLDNPDLSDIRKMVRQIIFTKLELRMLDESGLTIQELRKITDCLVEAIRSSMHVRVKYPWQNEEAKLEQPPTSEPSADAPQDVDNQADVANSVDPVGLAANAGRGRPRGHTRPLDVSDGALRK